VKSAQSSLADLFVHVVHEARHVVDQVVGHVDDPRVGGRGGLVTPLPSGDKVLRGNARVVAHDLDLD
jgi:hypothetical protein